MGSTVPYPEPTTAAATAIGQANRRRDTRHEVAVRSALHRRGLRFRVDLLVRAGLVRTHPDVVFTKARLAVFLDGCFWHVCPHHFHEPKSNLGYWRPKLAANQARDRRVDEALAGDGWTVVRIWEHVPVGEAVHMILAALVTLDHEPAIRALRVRGADGSAK
jgi:DNA mismatch endonuclease (patch repair protein)